MGRPRPAGSRLRRTLRRAAVTVLGGGLLVVGAAMVVLPGPGIVVGAVGLAVLATEFRWASRVLERCRSRVAVAVAGLTATRGATAAAALSAAMVTSVGAALLLLADGYRVMGATVTVGGVLAAVTLSATVRRRLGLEPPPAAVVAAQARAGGPGR